MKQLFKIQDTIGKRVKYARFFTDYGSKTMVIDDLVKNIKQGNQIALIFDDSFIIFDYNYWHREEIDLIVSTIDYTEQIKSLLLKMDL